MLTCSRHHIDFNKAPTTTVTKFQLELTRYWGWGACRVLETGRRGCSDGRAIVLPSHAKTLNIPLIDVERCINMGACDEGGDAGRASCCFTARAAWHAVWLDCDFS